MAQPHVSVSFRLDVTDMVAWCQANEASLFGVAVHRLCSAANQVPQLRQRIVCDGPRELVHQHRQIDPAFTVPAPNELFNFASAPLMPSLPDFLAELAAAAGSATETAQLTAFDGLRADVLYMSCLPWLDFTHVDHPVSSAIDSVPRVAWGKIVPSGERHTMAVNIQAHHALVDGRHLSAFAQAAQDQVDSLWDCPK